jgi:hypothetical protein
MVATAHADPAIANLAGALPAGWQLTTTKGELVIHRTEPVRVAGHHLANPHVGNLPVATAPTAPKITLELRYRIDPKWSPQRLADVQAANRKIYAALTALRARHRIDEIRTSKGLPLPATPDEEQRLAAYEAERARTLAQVQPLPRCTLGASSLFDSARTYAQLDLMVDPPGAMREAYAIVELVKRRCR